MPHTRPLAVVALLFAVGCHDDKDRGTCVETLKVGSKVYEQCVANELREMCREEGAVFTQESVEAGRSRCEGSGYSKLNRIAHSCDGSPSDMRMDTTSDWEANPSMVRTAIDRHCALEYEKPGQAK